MSVFTLESLSGSSTQSGSELGLENISLVLVVIIIIMDISQELAKGIN